MGAGNMADEGAQGGTGEDGTPPVTDWEAEAKRWQAEAERQEGLKRKVEGQNKKNTETIEQLRASALTDQERAVAEAFAKGKVEGAQETRGQFGHRLVDAEIRTAAAGRDVNVDALLETLDRGRFLGDDLEPDTRAIAAWVEKVTPAPRRTDAAGFDIGQGARGNGGTPPAGSLNDDEFMRTLIGKVGGIREQRR